MKSGTLANVGRASPRTALAQHSRTVIPAAPPRIETACADVPPAAPALSASAKCAGIALGPGVVSEEPVAKLT